jgi:hypothetical protein
MSADTSIIAASLSADVPIHNREQDLLGYHQFSAGNVTSVIQPAEIVPAVEDLLKKGSILPEQREALEQIVAGAKKWLTLGSANADERAE